MRQEGGSTAPTASTAAPGADRVHFRESELNSGRAICFFDLANWECDGRVD
jgi:hypothetical protein